MFSDFSTFPLRLNWNKHHPLVEVLYTEPGKSILRFLGAGSKDIKHLQCTTRQLDDVSVFLIKDKAVSSQHTLGSHGR